MPAGQPVPADCQQDSLLCAYVQDQGDTIIMQKSYFDKHPESDRDTYPETGSDIKRQLALVRYIHLKSLEKSELTLDDELSIKNIEVAIHMWWNVQLY